LNRKKGILAANDAQNRMAGMGLKITALRNELIFIRSRRNKKTFVLFVV
jgi:hypothetical protein